MDTECEMKCIPINEKQSSSDSHKLTEFILPVLEGIIIIAIIIRYAVARYTRYMKRAKSLQEALESVTSQQNHNQCKEHQQRQQQNSFYSNMEADTFTTINLLNEQANVALAAENYSEAINIYTKAIALDSKNCVFYSNRSEAYMKAGKYEEALHDASKSIKINSKWAKGYSQISSVLSFMQKFQSQP